MSRSFLRETLQEDLPTIQVVDVGAMSQGEDRYAGLVAQGLARVTGFEPNPEQFRRLAAKQGPYRYLPLFLGDGGPAIFQVARAPGCSSLYEPNPAVLDLVTSTGAGEGGKYAVVSTLPVQTCRLDDVPDLGAADFIKLDVQGAELDVLRHGTGVLGKALVLECEVEFLAMYKGQPLFGDIHAFLAGRGFMFHKFIDVVGQCLDTIVLDNSRFAPLSQMVKADAVFIRDFSRLERFADEELLKAAMVLHEMYLSYDVAFYFLQEHDRRRRTQLAVRYADKVFRQARLPTLYLNLMAGIPESLTIARNHHEAGRLDMAERMYRQILQAEPGHAEALHWLEVVVGHKAAGS